MVTRGIVRETGGQLAPLAGSVLLGVSASLAGCAGSPYEAAQLDAEVVAEDIRQAVGELIEEANRGAEVQDGQAFVEVKELSRVLILVPGTEPREREPVLGEEPPEPLPEGAVLREWTDRFALAQELSYRYSYSRISSISRTFDPPYFTAEVELWLDVARREAIAGEVQPQPEIPEGHVPWIPVVRSLRVAGGAGAGSSERLALPVPITPPGEVVSSSRPVDPLSRSALDGLLRERFETCRRTITAVLVYDHDAAEWKLKGWHPAAGFPRPTELPWSHGLSGEYAGYVLSPSSVPGRADAE